MLTEQPAKTVWTRRYGKIDIPIAVSEMQLSVDFVTLCPAPPWIDFPKEGQAYDPGK